MRTMQGKGNAAVMELRGDAEDQRRSELRDWISESELEREQDEMLPETMLSRQQRFEANPVNRLPRAYQMRVGEPPRVQPPLIR